MVKVSIALGALLVAAPSFAQTPPFTSADGLGSEYLSSRPEQQRPSARAPEMLPGRLNAVDKDFYPPALLKAGKNGGALIECRIGATGAPQDCVVLTESPAAMGVGAAALKLVAQDLRYGARTETGEATAGKLFVLPVLMSLGDEGQTIGSALFGRRTFFVSETRKGQPISEAQCNHAPDRTCYAYDLLLTGAPHFPAEAALVVESGKTEGRSIFDCEIRPEGRLGRCVASPDVTDAQVRPLARLIGQYRVAAKTPEGTDASSGRVIIAFDWAQMRKVIDASAVGRARRP